jgi:hypothetical protein
MVAPQQAKRMKGIELLSDEMTVAPRESGYELNIVGVYQDPLTQSWGVPMCRLAMQLAETAAFNMPLITSASGARRISSRQS